MYKILKLAKKYKLLVVEDCALALGAKIGKKHVGTWILVVSHFIQQNILQLVMGMLIAKSKKYYVSQKT